MFKIDGIMAKPNDLVLIYFSEQPSLFARIESIEPDSKKGWFHVTLLLLTIPMQAVTWILRDEYVNGETFTMGGKPIKIEAVKPFVPKKTSEPGLTPTDQKEGGETGNVIPFKKPK